MIFVLVQMGQHTAIWNLIAYARRPHSHFQQDQSHHMHGRIQRGDRGSRPLPLKNKKKYRVSLQYWSGSPEKSQSYQVSIQCWADDGPFIAAFVSYPLIN